MGPKLCKSLQESTFVLIFHHFVIARIRGINRNHFKYIYHENQTVFLIIFLHFVFFFCIIAMLFLDIKMPKERYDLSTACLLVYNSWKPEWHLSSYFFNLKKRKPNLISCFKTSKYISRTLLYAFQPLKTLRVYSLLPFNWEKHQSYFASWFLTTKYLIYWLFWVFKALKTCAVLFFVVFQRLKTSVVPSFRQFNI